MDIKNVSMERPEINEIMSKIREVTNKSKILSGNNVEKTQGNFESLLNIAKDSVSQVNDLQNTSEDIKTAFITGSKDVSFSQVIIASQKSKLAFEGLLAVRNKILDAYREIMSMQV